MSDAVTVKLYGDRELIRKLESFGTRLAKKGLRRATRAGAKVILPEARKLAQVWKGSKKKAEPGLLKRNIKVRAIKRSRRYVGVRVTVDRKLFTGEAWYAGPQEFGWKTGKRGSSGRRHVEGKHFLEKAADAKREQAGAMAVSVLRNEIHKAMTSG